MRITRVLVMSALLSTSCTLLAPSDEVLMGGSKTNIAGDAADGSNDSPSGVACSQVAQSCMPPHPCCSGLWCVPAANICAPCQAAGSQCPPGPMGNQACCSGTCMMNTCQ